MTRSQEGHGPGSPDPQLLQRLAVEGEAGFSEYETGGRPEVLEAAVTAFRLAVNVVPPGHPARAMDGILGTHRITCGATAGAREAVRNSDAWQQPCPRPGGGRRPSPPSIPLPAKARA